MRRARSWTMSETAYPSIRRVMGPERHRLDDAALEDRLSELFPNAEPEDVEDFMRTMQRFGNDAAPIAQRALPGVMQGAMQGGMMAGPWGAVAGGLAGGAASLLGGGGGGGVPRAVRQAFWGGPDRRNRARRRAVACQRRALRRCRVGPRCRAL